MEWLGAEFQALITPLLDWIKKDSVGPAIAGVIVIAGGLILAFGFYRTAREFRWLRRARNVIAWRSDDEFAKQFNVIDQDLRQIDRIGFAWSEFSETLIRPKIDELGAVVRPCENTVRPHTYFNMRDMGIGPDFMKVFPSVFVGVGLSLTFLGLISALQEAVAAINSSAGNTASIQVAIGNLLKISSAKFYASLFALFMSVLMTIVIRAMSWVLSHELGALNRSIEGGVRFLTQEQLAMRSNDLLGEQLVQLQTFNTDLAMKIGEQIESSLNETLRPVIDRIDTMGGDITEQNIESMRKISDEVAKGIQGATGASMDRVANKLDGISEKLGGLSEALTTALSGFDEEFSKMLGDLKEALAASTKDVAEDVGKSMGAMSRDIESSADKITGLIGQLSGSINSMANAGAEISRRSGEELQRQVKAASEEAAAQMAEAGRSLASGFQESTSGLVAALGSATNQLRTLEEGLVGLPPKLTEVNTKLETSASRIGQAADTFTSATDGIEGILRPLADYARQSNEAIQSISESLNSTAEQVSQAAASIESSVGTLEREVSAQVSRLDGSDEQLAKLLISIEDSTGKVITQINKFVSEIDDGFRSSVGLLKEAINEFEEVVDSVKQVSQENR